jgi:hypothetical protein
MSMRVQGGGFIGLIGLEWEKERRRLIVHVDPCVNKGEFKLSTCSVASTN